MSALAVEAEGLVKTFGSTRALDGIDLQIPLENPGLIWLSRSHSFLRPSCRPGTCLRC